MFATLQNRLCQKKKKKERKKNFLVELSNKKPRPSLRLNPDPDQLPSDCRAGMGVGEVPNSREKRNPHLTLGGAFNLMVMDTCPHHQSAFLLPIPQPLAQSRPHFWPGLIAVVFWLLSLNPPNPPLTLKFTSDPVLLQLKN